MQSKFWSAASFCQDPPCADICEREEGMTSMSRTQLFLKQCKAATYCYPLHISCRIQNNEGFRYITLIYYDICKCVMHRNLGVTSPSLTINQNHANYFSLLKALISLQVSFGLSLRSLTQIYWNSSYVVSKRKYSKSQLKRLRSPLGTKKPKFLSRVMSSVTLIISVKIHSQCTLPTCGHLLFTVKIQPNIISNNESFSFYLSSLALF